MSHDQPHSTSESYGLTPGAPEGTKPARVAVVGSGLAGVRAATALVARGCRVIVLEEREEQGGKAAGANIEGFTVDRSVQLLSFEDRNLIRFADELELSDRLLPLRPVATGQLHEGAVVPTSAATLREIARMPGVTRRDALRLMRLPRLMSRYAPLLDLERPERAADLDYRSLADFARLYLGRSVFERFAAPLVTSATLGDEHEQSRVAWLLLWHASRYGAAQPGIAGAGLSALVEGARKHVDIRTDVRVQELKQLPNGGFSVDCSTSAGDQSLTVEAVVVTTAPDEAHRIAKSLVTPAERDFFDGAKSGPLVTLSVGVDHPLTGLPQLVRVPHTERSPIEVMLLEPGTAGGRAPEGAGLVTLSATGAYANRRTHVSDPDVEAELVMELGRVYPRAKRKFRFAALHRDPTGVPRFDVGAYRALASFQRVQEDRRGLGRRLYFAGDYLSGPRFEDAISSGLRAANALLADLEEAS